MADVTSFFAFEPVCLVLSSQGCSPILTPSPQVQDDLMDVLVEKVSENSQAI